MISNLNLNPIKLPIFMFNLIKKQILINSILKETILSTHLKRTQKNLLHMNQINIII
jgi:hypothetical protein